MTVWDWMSWAAVAILGPGAIAIFVLFVRGMLKPPEK